MNWLAEVWAWLGTVTGVSNESGPWYAFWSGIGSDIGEVTLIGGAIAIYRHHTCHVDRCWRLGKHAYTRDGAAYILCKKHHPDVPDKVTADSITGPAGEKAPF